MRFFLLTLLVLMAQPAYAAVSIHEVAWMGSTASANHEWVELFNSGNDSVSVDGWILSDGMNFSITLTGSIGAGSYAVLERTSEASSAASAFLIYTGALVNTGATLTLRDAQAGVVDQVAGGTDWKNIGGDNASKETAQYQSTGWVTDVATPGQPNGTGWVTDVATPGQPNGTGRVEDTPPVEEDTPADTPPVTSTGNTSTESKSRSNKSSDSIRLKNPEIKLTVLPDVQGVAYTHQAVPFNVRTGGVDENLEKLVRYDWNFGDSYTGSGKNPEHAYAYPGTYVVTVRAEYKKNVQVARHELTILPVNFSLTQNSEGDMQLHNDAAYDVDVSGYTLRGTKEVTFPPRTIMAARSTLTLARKRIKESPHELIGLYDTRGELVTTSSPKNVIAGVLTSFADVESVVAAPKSASAINQVESLTGTASGFGFRIASAEASEPAPAETLTISPAEAATPTTSPSDNRVMYFVLIGVLLLAVVSLLIPKNTAVEST